MNGSVFHDPCMYTNIASNVYCNADIQYSARTVQVFVATYVVITFLETCDVSDSAAI